MKRFNFLKTYRQHNYAVLALFLVLILVSYSTNIRVALNSYQEFQNVKSKIALAQSASQDIAIYRSEIKSMQETAQQPYNKELLLEQITLFCKEHNLLIKNFPGSKRVIENNYPIVTNEIEVQGSYNDIVELAYMFEQEKKLTSINSLSFTLVKDREKQQQYLHGLFVLRNIETQQNEN